MSAYKRRLLHWWPKAYTSLVLPGSGWTSSWLSGPKAIAGMRYPKISHEWNTTEQWIGIKSYTETWDSKIRVSLHYWLSTFIIVLNATWKKKNIFSQISSLNRKWLSFSCTFLTFQQISDILNCLALKERPIYEYGVRTYFSLETLLAKSTLSLAYIPCHTELYWLVYRVNWTNLLHFSF